MTKPSDQSDIHPGGASVSEQAELLEIIAWVDLEQAETIQRLLECMDDTVRVVAVGGPRVAELARLAQRYDCPQLDDPRRLLVEHPTSFWLTSSMKLLALDDLAAALEQGTNVVSLEPFMEALQDPAELGRKQTQIRKQRKQPLTTPGHLSILGALIESPGFTGNSGAEQEMGEDRLLRVQCTGPAAGRSLFARLFDAWRTVLTLLPMPERIDASLAERQAAAPSRPGLLSGKLAAHARVPDGGAVVVTVSDQNVEERMSLDLTGSGGEMHVRPDAYEIYLCESDEREARTDLVATNSIADLVAWQWRRLIGRADFVPQDPRAPMNEQVLACCHACLLSARTGEPERPEKLLQIKGS